MHCKRCDDHMNSICPKIKVPMELEVYCQLLFLNVFVSCHVDAKIGKLSQLQLHMKNEESWLHLLTIWCLPNGYNCASHFHFNCQWGTYLFFNFILLSHIHLENGICSEKILEQLQHLIII